MRRDVILNPQSGFAANVWFMESEGDTRNMERSVLRNPPPGYVNSANWLDDRRVVIVPAKVEDVFTEAQARDILARVLARAAATAKPAAEASAGPAGEAPPPPLPVADELDAQPDPTLQRLCGQLGIKSRGKMPRDEMIAHIRQKRKALQSPQPAAVGAAGGS